jgi:molybdopterin-guanine dinucleotide biosynthesis protein B
MINPKQKIIAISGVKNSGKTTLIVGLIPLLKAKNFKIATIKHDGHDFQPDVEGTDSYRHAKAGAYGTGIFSNNRWMIIKEEKEVDISNLIKEFPEADLIILEGFKFSDYPKVEIIRGANSKAPVSKKETVLCYVSDLDEFNKDIPQFNLDELEELSEFLYKYIIE